MFGTLMTVWGVIRLAIAPTFLGLVVLYLAKLWFIDRMVWLHERLEGESNGTRTGHTQGIRTVPAPEEELNAKANTAHPGPPSLGSERHTRRRMRPRQAAHHL